MPNYFLLFHEPAHIADIMTHNRFPNLKAWAYFSLRLPGQCENHPIGSSPPIVCAYFLTAIHLRYRAEPPVRRSSAGRPRCNRNSADGQLGRALPACPPLLPTSTQYLPRAVTSYPLTSARLGKGDGRASRKQKNQL